MELEGKQREAILKGRSAMLDMQVSAAQLGQQMQYQAQQNQMKLATQHASHQQQMQQQKESTKLSLKKRAKPNDSNNQK